VLKMTTMLEVYNTEEQRSVVNYFVSKTTQCKGYHTEIFPVYGGKYLSSKAVHKWFEKVSQGRSKVADDARPGAEFVETTVNRLPCCGFQCTGKAMGQVYQCCWRICREINVFTRFEYHMFYVSYPFVTYLLTLPRVSLIN
jgi:hypothetical protein